LELHQPLQVIELPGAFLQALLVQHVALHQILPQNTGSPLPKVRAPQRLHPVANRDDNIEVVVLNTVLLAIGGSCQGFLDNCRFI